MKIGVYGGSFNPPHNGHLYLATEVSKRLCLDKVIIIPSNISPQKDNNGNIDPMHRINMCKDVFSDSLFEVSSLEIDRGGKSYTVDTLTALKALYPGSDMYLFMGSDMLLSFHSWFRFADILKMCTICAISREDEKNADVLENYAKTVLSDGNVLIFDVTPIEVSSSLVRENIRNGKSCNGLISEKTEKYIKENNLYGQ